MPPTKETHRVKAKGDSFYSSANVEHLRRSIAQVERELSPETQEAIREAEEGRLEKVTLDELRAELKAIH